MGIHGLRQSLPWIYIKDYLSAFPLQTLLFDAANLIFWCASRHAVEFEKGNYLPAVKEYQHYLQYLASRKMKMAMLFDGKHRKEKAPEDERRQATRAEAKANVDEARSEGIEPDLKHLKALVHNTSEYIALCVKCCAGLRIPFTVCYEEADAGLAAAAKAGDCLIVSLDSDMAALGVSKWLFVTSWLGGSATLIDLEAIEADAAKATEATGDVSDSDDGESGDEEEEYPLVRHVLKHGPIIFQFWAFVCGCDFSTEGCGVRNTGKTQLLAILDEVYDVAELAVGDVVSLISCETMDAQQLTSEFATVSSAFTTGALYYSPDGAVCRLSDGAEVTAASVEARAHMCGERDPKSGSLFTAEFQAQLDGLHPALLLHDYRANASQAPGATLSKSPEACGVAELRLFITARGGTSSGVLKADLVAIVMAYLELEKEVPPILVDRSEGSGLMLAKIETKHGTDPRATIRGLMADGGVQKSVDPFPLAEFLGLVDDQYKSDNFSDDQDDIITAAPEMHAGVINYLYAPLGGGAEMKSMRDSLSKSCEQNGIIYHAMALLDDTVLLVTKQAASLRKDQTTRKETEAGEKPLPDEYLVILELGYEKTTVESHGHELGVITKVLRSWCPCTAGRSLCVHRGMALWSQLHHWDDDRPTDKPCTASLCGWVRGSKKRCYNVVGTVSALTFEQIDAGRPKKQARACHESKPEGARYECLSKSDRGFFECHMGPASFGPLYSLIQKENS
jgi:hypothetical protein